MFTEASKRKKASLWLVRGADALAEQHDRGGVEPLEVDEAGFQAALTSRNRTLKRALCDPTTFSGIGNAYSDEILFHAGLSPVQRTGNLDNEEVARLYEATRTTLVDWTERYRQTVGDGFPDKVTAFHDDMAVHGKYNQPARCARSPCSASSTPTTRSTTAPSAKPTAASSLTAPSPASSKTTGPAASKTSKAEQLQHPLSSILELAGGEPGSSPVAGRMARHDNDCIHRRIQSLLRGSSRNTVSSG